MGFDNFCFKIKHVRPKGYPDSTCQHVCLPRFSACPAYRFVCLFVSLREIEREGGGGGEGRQTGTETEREGEGRM